MPPKPSKDPAARSATKDFLKLALLPTWDQVGRALDVQALFIMAASYLVAAGGGVLVNQFLTGIGKSVVIKAALLAVLRFCWAGIRLQGRVNEFEAQPRPRLALHQLGVAYRLQKRTVRYEVSGGTVPTRPFDAKADFHWASFVNLATRKGPGSEALDLHAKVTFYDSTGAPVIPVSDGRWGGIAEPKLSEPAPKSLPRLPASGEGAELVLALQFVGKNEVFGYGHHANPVGTGLGSGEYKIEVVIEASNMDDEQHFWFTLTNTDGAMSVTDGEDNARTPYWEKKRHTPDQIVMVETIGDSINTVIDAGGDFG